MNDILCGMKFLHNSKILHRDLKPENVLLNNGTWKICDYGLSRFADGNAESKRDYTKVGTGLYMCPEILSNKKFSMKCDIYSAGVILYQIMYNWRFPFKGNS